MTDDDFWAMERRFWLDGPAFYDERLDPDCLMAFSGIGILRGARITDSLSGAPRWQSVEITDRSVAAPDGNIRVLGYRAVARRDDDGPYRCWCTSTYRRVPADGRWRLIQHQQTPLTGD